MQRIKILISVRKIFPAKQRARWTCLYVYLTLEETCPVRKHACLVQEYFIDMKRAKLYDDIRRGRVVAISGIMKEERDDKDSNRRG